MSSTEKKKKNQHDQKTEDSERRRENMGTNLSMHVHLTFSIRCAPFHLLEPASSAISLDLSPSGLTCSSYLGIIVWAVYKLHKFISHGFGDRKSGSGYQHGQRVAPLFSFANGYLFTMSSHGGGRFSLCLSLSLFLSLSLPFCLSAPPRLFL